MNDHYSHFLVASMGRRFYRAFFSSFTSISLLVLILGNNSTHVRAQSPNTEDAPPTRDFPNQASYRVERFVGGDTVELEIAGGVYTKVRLVGVDTPEALSGAFGGKTCTGVDRFSQSVDRGPSCLPRIGCHVCSGRPIRDLRDLPTARTMTDWTMRT